MEVGLQFALQTAFPWLSRRCFWGSRVANRYINLSRKSSNRCGSRQRCSWKRQNTASNNTLLLSFYEIVIGSTRGGWSMYLRLILNYTNEKTIWKHLSWILKSVGDIKPITQRTHNGMLLNIMTPLEPVGDRRLPTCSTHLCFPTRGMKIAQAEKMERDVGFFLLLKTKRI